MYTMKDQSLLEAICELYKEGATIREVAQVSGVSVATVGAILKERGLTRNKGCKTRYVFGNRVLPGAGSPPRKRGCMPRLRVQGTPVWRKVLLRLRRGVAFAERSCGSGNRTLA